MLDSSVDKTDSLASADMHTNKLADVSDGMPVNDISNLSLHHVPNVGVVCEKFQTPDSLVSPDMDTNKAADLSDVMPVGDISNSSWHQAPNVDVEHENWLTNIEDKPDGSEVCEVSDTLTPVSTQTCHEKATDELGCSADKSENLSFQHVCHPQSSATSSHSANAFPVPSYVHPSSRRQTIQFRTSALKKSLSSITKSLGNGSISKALVEIDRLYPSVVNKFITTKVKQECSKMNQVENTDRLCANSPEELVTLNMDKSGNKSRKMLPFFWIFCSAGQNRNKTYSINKVTTAALVLLYSRSNHLNAFQYANAVLVYHNHLQKEGIAHLSWV